MSIQSRAWTYIVYPESAPDDWQVALRQSGLMSGVSPLHDSDVYPEGHKLAGQLKKEHWHVIVVWKNRTTYKHASELGHEFFNVNTCKLCGSVKGAIDYWDHDEESDKFKYSLDSAKFYNGLTIEDLPDIKAEGEREFVSSIKNIIRQNNLSNYWAVDNWLETQIDDPELWDFFRKHTIYFKEILFGYRKTQKIDIFEKVEIENQIEKMKKENGYK